MTTWLRLSRQSINSNEKASYRGRLTNLVSTRCTVAKLVDECMKAKRADGASKHYLEDISSRLSRFAIDSTVRAYRLLQSCPAAGICDRQSGGAHRKGADKERSARHPHRHRDRSPSWSCFEIRFHHRWSWRKQKPSCIPEPTAGMRAERSDNTHATTLTTMIAEPKSKLPKPRRQRNQQKIKEK